MIVRIGGVPMCVHICPRGQLALPKARFRFTFAVWTQAPRCITVVVSIQYNGGLKRFARCIHLLAWSSNGAVIAAEIQRSVSFISPRCAQTWGRRDYIMVDLSRWICHRLMLTDAPWTIFLRRQLSRIRLCHSTVPLGSLSKCEEQ